MSSKGAPTLKKKFAWGGASCLVLINWFTGLLCDLVCQNDSCPIQGPEQRAVPEVYKLPSICWHKPLPENEQAGL